MAKQERTKAQDKDANTQQSQAAQANQPENETKLPAEQGAGERTHDRPMFLPQVDIYETETGLVVAADLPGVKPDGLEVTLEKRVLSIYGRVDEETPEGYSLVYREYEVGDFEHRDSFKWSPRRRDRPRAQADRSAPAPAHPRRSSARN